MSANPHLALLFSQLSRYDLAEQELRQELATKPNNSVAHASLSLCLSSRRQYQEAVQSAQLAIELASNSLFLSFAYYALAFGIHRWSHLSVYHCNNRLSKAQAAIEEAIRLDSSDANCFALLATIRFEQGNYWHKALMEQCTDTLFLEIRLDKAYWREGLEAAKQGLMLDPEHDDCIYLQTRILSNLSREQ